MAATELRLADWHDPDDRAALRAIRQTVFIDEQRVPVELEWDEFDDSSTHFIALQDAVPVATARLKTDGQLGRMAVLRPYRHRHIGSALLDFVIDYARAQNMPSLFCHAQISALDFYRRRGFNEYGETFSDAGIPHRAMKLDLGNDLKP